MPHSEKKVEKGSDDKKLTIAVGDTVRWGSRQVLGVVEAVRIIDSGAFVQSFCGSLEDVVLTIRDTAGTVSIWPRDNLVTKQDDHQEKG